MTKPFDTSCSRIQPTSKSGQTEYRKSVLTQNHPCLCVCMWNRATVNTWLSPVCSLCMMERETDICRALYVTIWRHIGTVREVDEEANVYTVITVSK